MKNQVSDLEWSNILTNFATYKGSIVNFCKENNIKTHQLYYRRKRSDHKHSPTFHAVNLKKELSANKSSKEVNPSFLKPTSNIKIEIGKAKIYIPGNDKESLSSIVEAVLKLC